MSKDDGLSPLADAGAGIAEAEYANRLLSAVEGRPYVPLTESNDPLVNLYFGALAVWFLWPFAAIALGLITLWWLGPAALLAAAGFGAGLGIGSAAHAGVTGGLLGAVAAGVFAAIHLTHRIKKHRRKGSVNAALAIEDEMRRSEPMPSYGPPVLSAPSMSGGPGSALPSSQPSSQEAAAVAAQRQQQALADLYAAQDERALRYGDQAPGH